MSFSKCIKKLAIIFKIDWGVGTYTACVRFSFSHQVKICLFISIGWWACGRNIIVLLNNTVSFMFALIFKFLALSFLLAFIIWEINFYMALFTTSKAGIIVSNKIIEFLVVILFGGLILVAFFLQEFFFLLLFFF